MNFSLSAWKKKEHFKLFPKHIIRSNINKIKMLGRKQSLKGEPVLADYGPEESLNESADIEWVNKVCIPELR